MKNFQELLREFEITKFSYEEIKNLTYGQLRDLLGIEKSNDEEIDEKKIEKCYRQRSSQLHPDKNQHRSEEAKQEFQFLGMVKEEFLKYLEKTTTNSATESTAQKEKSQFYALESGEEKQTIKNEDNRKKSDQRYRNNDEKNFTNKTASFYEDKTTQNKNNQSNTGTFERLLGKVSRRFRKEKDFSWTSYLGNAPKYKDGDRGH